MFLLLSSFYFFFFSPRLLPPRSGRKEEEIVVDDCDLPHPSAGSRKPLSWYGFVEGRYIDEESRGGAFPPTFAD